VVYERKLGAFESAAALTGEAFAFNAVVAVSLSGAPSLKTLRDALDTVQERHSLLKARIVRRGAGRRFVTDVSLPIPLTVLPPDLPGGWRAYADEELNRTFDWQAGPLIRVGYVPPAGEDGRGDVVVTVHHAIADATSLSALVAEVLGLCAGSLETDRETAESRGVLPAVEDLFPRPFRGWRGLLKRAVFTIRQINDEVSFKVRGAAMRRPPLHSAGRARTLSAALSPEATRALVRRCRRLRLTLNSVLCAAMLVAVKRALHGGETRSLLRNFVFADLRPYLASPPAPGDLGTCFGMLRHTLEIRDDTGIWDCAHLVNRAVYKSGRRGEKFAAVALSYGMMKMILGMRNDRMGNTAVSYTGVATLPESYGTLAIEELHAFVSNFVLGPEYTAQVRMFSGRLWWDIVYLDSDMNRARAVELAEGIVDLLELPDPDGE